MMTQYHKILRQSARDVLDRNWNGHFTRPAPSLYPHQWNWDTGFIVIGLATYDWKRVEKDLQFLFRGQWKNGMLPHIIFGNDPEARYFPGPEFWQAERASMAPEQATSGITQPPVFGFALWHAYRHAPNRDEAKTLLRALYPKILAQHAYLYRDRDPAQEGLAYICHPWEPGTDNSPTWDSALQRIDPQQVSIPPYTRKDLQNPRAAAHRPTQADYDRYVYLVDLFRSADYEEAKIAATCPFIIQDPLFNAILIYSTECLMHIARLLDEPTNQLEAWRTRAVAQMNAKLWNPQTGLYDAWDVVQDQRIEIQTSSGLIPLLAGIPSKTQAEQIQRTLEGPMFSSRDTWLCPTYSLLAEDINYEKYWRGPVWINMNWLLYQGAKRYNLDTVAERLRTDSLELLNRFGFYEYFDPRRKSGTREGYGTDQFSWSASCALDWLAET